MSLQVQQKQRSLTENLPRPSLQARGFLVDENGREIAITERMIQQACEALDQQWVAPRAANR
ncbi:PA1571 family protein [Halopseudomonas bauzanensis]|uniref:PA1571 family protein n=1 Tax=Halopseudomonas bauzanensis TaxID=653930 RepID=UPI002555F658|nr:PA1571 family protein [Halopseudomonas bauzanensis]